MATLVSVITLVLTGQLITPVNVFMLLSFIQLVSYDTCLCMASALLQTYDAYASLRRIEDFLVLENHADHSAKESNSTKAASGYLHQQEKLEDVLSANQVEYRGKPSFLRVSNLTYRQIEREHKFILQDIEFSAGSQSLTVITGPVGSGKSTLLSAIAGEISDISGTITCQGTLVYVPQTAWIFSGTIRENILFGQPYDEQKYTRAIEACALTQDIQQFPDRDQTVVGERGEVLSGGQQARVSLARAVYADTDIYLLDDPLSAVDFKVGQHIFNKCMKDLLGDKIRVITSHQEQHMKEADEVIVLCKGRVMEKGSVPDLLEKGILSSAVDPLYQTARNDSTIMNFVQQKEQKSDFERMMPLANEAKGLEISQEDRAIGVVSWKLYWEYFRSGTPSSVIFAMICFYFISQGKTQ